MDADPSEFRFGGVTVAWEPRRLLLRMTHGPEPTLSDQTAWTLGKQMGQWIRGLEGTVGVVVDASGVPALPDDWRDYWIKVLRKGFIKGFAVHGASRPFARTAADLARLTGVPLHLGDEASCRAFLDALPPLRSAAP